jgi:hypothetical protein
LARRRVRSCSAHPVFSLDQRELFDGAYHVSCGARPADRISLSVEDNGALYWIRATADQLRAMHRLQWVTAALGGRNKRRRRNKSRCGGGGGKTTPSCRANRGVPTGHRYTAVPCWSSQRHFLRRPTAPRRPWGSVLIRATSTLLKVPTTTRESLVRHGDRKREEQTQTQTVI